MLRWTYLYLYLSLTFKLQGRKHAAGFPCVYFGREFYLIRNKDQKKKTSLLSSYETVISKLLLCYMPAVHQQNSSPPVEDSGSRNQTNSDKCFSTAASNMALLQRRAWKQLSFKVDTGHQRLVSLTLYAVHTFRDLSHWLTLAVNEPFATQQSQDLRHTFGNVSFQC